MKITIEFNTSNPYFESDYGNAVNRIMKQARLMVMDCLTKPIPSGPAPINIPIKDMNGNRVGVLEIYC
jgi:hypothetical protein